MEEQGLAYKTIETYKANLNVINRTFKDQTVSTIKAVAVNRYLNDALYKKNYLMVLFIALWSYFSKYLIMLNNLAI